MSLACPCNICTIMGKMRSVHLQTPTNDGIAKKYVTIESRTSARGRANYGETRIDRRSLREFLYKFPRNINCWSYCLGG